MGYNIYYDVHEVPCIIDDSEVDFVYSDSNRVIVVFNSGERLTISSRDAKELIEKIWDNL